MIIDVIHDTVCPWRRIGKRLLDDALSGWDGPAVTVRWRPFLLDSAIPPAGLDFRAYMSRAKGGDRVVEPLFAAVQDAGAAAGLTFNFEKVRYAPSSIPSHRLIALTPSAHRGRVLDAVHDAYFERGLDIGDPDTLAALWFEVGLDGTHVAPLLHDDVARDAVLAETAWARDLGVQGVPLYVVDGTVALFNAPSAAALRALLQQASDRVRERQERMG